MYKKIIYLFFSCVILMFPFSNVALATENNTSNCYIATTVCPADYIAYTNDNISKFILSIDGYANFNSVSVGTPFAFSDANADVYYFPIICDGRIEYLFRVYPDGDTFSSAITAFLADEIECLAEYTSANNPMYLNLIDTKIVATIGLEHYVLFEYPDNMAMSDDGIDAMSIIDYSVIDVKNPTDIELDLRQTRDIATYITLDLRETQSGGNWCTAYCLATIIRTKTSYYTTASDVMTYTFGSTPSTNTAFPWFVDGGATMVSVASHYGLHPTVLTTTVSNSVLIAEINAGRPCIVAMDKGTAQHAVVLRGYSSLGTWGIWNPWFNFYESYSMTGSYVPTGFSASIYSFTPYMHAYNFG